MKKKIAFYLAVFGFLFSCAEETILPDEETTEIYELKIVSPESKSYPANKYVSFDFTFFSNINDSVEVDSVHWYSNIQGKVGYGRLINYLKVGIHDIVCKVYKGSEVFEKSVSVQSIGEIKVNTVELGNSWKRLDFSDEVEAHKIRFNNGKMYIGTYNSGMIYQENDSWKYYSEGDISHAISDVEFDGDKIIAGDFAYPFLYILENNSWTKIGLNELATWSNDVHALCKETDGKIWIGLHSGKILLYEDGLLSESDQPEVYFRTNELIFKNGKLYGYGNFSSPFIKDGNHWKKISIDSTPTGIAVDENEVFWIGSAKGLFKYAEGEVSFYSKEENGYLIGISNVYVDKKNRLWVSCSQGICFYDGTGWKNFERTLFTDLNNFWCSHINEDSDGNIFFVIEGAIFKYEN